jgi:hypothetical protein
VIRVGVGRIRQFFRLLPRMWYLGSFRRNLEVGSDEQWYSSPKEVQYQEGCSSKCTKRSSLLWPFPVRVCIFVYSSHSQFWKLSTSAIGAWFVQM